MWSRFLIFVTLSGNCNASKLSKLMNKLQYQYIVEAWLFNALLIFSHLTCLRTTHWCYIYTFNTPWHLTFLKWVCTATIYVFVSRQKFCLSKRPLYCCYLLNTNIIVYLLRVKYIKCTWNPRYKIPWHDFCEIFNCF